MGDLTFRPISDNDVDATLSMYNHYVATSSVTFDVAPWNRADMLRKIDAVRALQMPFVVAEYDGEVVGYGYLSTWREKCAYETTMENTLYLRDDMRGRGFGGMLLDELLRLGAILGIREVIAVISDAEDAAPSVRLHEKHGFRRVGAMAHVGRKFDRWIGVVMLQRSLSS